MSNYPERDLSNYPEEKVKKSPPYCHANDQYGDCPCRTIFDLKKQIADLEEKIEKLREYLESFVLINFPDFSDHFRW